MHGDKLISGCNDATTPRSKNGTPTQHLLAIETQDHYPVVMDSNMRAHHRRPRYDTVWLLVMHGDKLVSGSFDGTRHGVANNYLVAGGR
jgi:hypothetical protein